MSENSHQQVVDAYFAAMRRGAKAEDDLLDLFTPDALYVEPFTGTSEPAEGIEEIRARFRLGWQNPPPGLELDVLSVALTADEAEAAWECRSPAFPGPVRGRDHYRFVDGRIAELRVTLDPDPGRDPGP